MNPKSKGIAENVMILSVLCYMLLPMIWYKTIMARELDSVKNGVKMIASNKNIKIDNRGIFYM